MILIITTACMKSKNGFVALGILAVLIAVFMLLGGGWWYINTMRHAEPRQSTTPPPAPAASPTQGVMDTSMWKTYRNEEFGFEFQLPFSWQQGTSKRGGLYFDGQQEGHIEILPRGDDLNFSDRPANLSPTEREKYKMNLDQFFMRVVGHNDAFQNIQKTTLNGYNAYEIDFRTMVSEGIGEPYHEEIAFAVFVENEKGYVYQIMFDDRSNKNALTNQERQILSTFKFIK